MIHIKYKIDKSKIHGVGLFTEQDIKSGDLIYTPNALLDINLSEQEFESLTPEEKKEVEYYGYFNKKTSKWHVAFDMIRILNHGGEENANITQDDEMVMTAKKDILKGQELLQDYKEIYPKDGDHFNKINNF